MIMTIDNLLDSGIEPVQYPLFRVQNDVII